MIGITKFNCAIGWVKKHTKITGHNRRLESPRTQTPDLAWRFSGGEYRCSYLSIESQICNSPGNKKGSTANATSLNCIFLRYLINQSGHHSVNRCWRKVQLSDCLALRCLRLISPCMAVTINCPVLSPISLTKSISLTTSCGILTDVFCDLLLMLPVAMTISLLNRCPSLYMEINQRIALTCPSLNNKVSVTWSCLMTLEITKPGSVPPLAEPLTTNDTQTIEVAMNKHITPVTGRNSLTPNIVFTWRFAECQENKATYHHVTAHTEDEARSQLLNLPLVFTARIRQGVTHV